MVMSVYRLEELKVLLPLVVAIICLFDELEAEGTIRLLCLVYFAVLVYQS